MKVLVVVLFFMYYACDCTCISRTNSCPDSFVNLSTGCYHFAPDKHLSYVDSMRYCMQKNSSLLALETPEEVFAIRLHLHNTPSLDSYYYTAAMRVFNEFVWLPTFEKVNYSDWCFDNPTSTGNCVLSRVTNEKNCWSSHECKEFSNVGIICEIKYPSPTSLLVPSPLPPSSSSSEPPCQPISSNCNCTTIPRNGSCPDDFVKLTTGCYHFAPNEHLSYTDSLQYCKQKNSSLLALETMNEGFAVKLHLQDNTLGSDFYYTSALLVRSEYVWMTSYERINYTDWCSKGKIDNDCILLVRNGEYNFCWFAHPCAKYESTGIICETNIPT